VIMQKEVEVNREMKLKTKAYITSLVIERDSLLVERKTMQVIVTDLREEVSASMQSHEQKQYESRRENDSIIMQLRNDIEEYQTKLELKDSEYKALYGKEEAQKDLMLKDLESHKAKRMTARSEIISMAHITENMQSDMKKVQHTLKNEMTSKVKQHILDLEKLLTHLEIVNTYLTSSSLSSSSTSSSNIATSPLSGKIGDNRGSEIGEGGVGSELFFSLDELQYRLQQCATGIALLQSAMFRLAETAHIRYESNNCCRSVMNVFYKRPGESASPYDRVKMDSSSTGHSIHLDGDI